MVKSIAGVFGKNIRLTGGFNWALKLLGKLGGKPGGLVNKAFGNMVYEKSMSEYDFEYQIYDLQESIRLTEETE